MVRSRTGRWNVWRNTWPPHDMTWYHVTIICTYSILYHSIVCYTMWPPSRPPFCMRARSARGDLRQRGPLSLSLYIYIYICIHNMCVYVCIYIYMYCCCLVLLFVVQFMFYLYVSSSDIASLGPSGPAIHTSGWRGLAWAGHTSISYYNMLYYAIQ